MIKVLIVDDHQLVRIGLIKLLSDVEGIEVIDEASSGEEALQIIREKKPDVILMDVMMPGIGGLETTRRVTRSDPDMKVIAVSACDEEPFPSRVLQAGALGYLTKGCSLEEMLVAIRRVYNGQRYISSQMAQQLVMKKFSEEPESPFDSLSDRELQVMLMIVSGQNVQAISDKLCLSTKTINTYRYRLFEKLRVDNDVEMTHLALRYGLLDKDRIDRGEQ